MVLLITTHQGDAQFKAAVNAVVARAIHVNDNVTQAAADAGLAAHGVNAPQGGGNNEDSAIAGAALGAAMYVIKNGGTKAEAVEAALTAAAARRIVNAGTGAVRATDVGITANVEAAYDAAVTLSNDAGGLAVDIYVAYNSVAAGGYDTNKLEPTMEKCSTALIEKTLDDNTADANGKTSKDLLIERLKDDTATDLQTEEERAWSQNLFVSGLETTRNVQANLKNQSTNVESFVDALRAVINVTEKGADSYLKTDYVLTAQKYAELIRIMVAAVTAMQAANKIPEAAQQLIAGLTR